MKKKTSKQKVLLIEPNYKNKYPPIGLMKISTYHKQLGYEVVFYKGDLKHFVIERIVLKCISVLKEIEKYVDWYQKQNLIFEYIRTKNHELLELLESESNGYNLLIRDSLIFYKDYYHKGKWKEKEEREWDRVFITTLFTFYWSVTIDTINFCKNLVKPDGMLQVGGVLATIQAEEIYRATDIKPHKGILRAGDLDKGNKCEIDNLPLDYSILDEIDYRYPMSNAFYGYMTRGCIRKCPFCAVPILEPIYNDYIPMQPRIEYDRERYGDQKDLLLMDNNVLASKHFKKIIDDIIACGFGKNAIFISPDYLSISIRNLREGINDRAYIKRSQRLLEDFYYSLQGKDKYLIYELLKEKYNILHNHFPLKENIIQCWEEIQEVYKKHFKPSKKLRFVDFNQGVDARLLTDAKAKLLSKINIRPLRIAFDDIKIEKIYTNAIITSAKYGITHFSNYLLYNFHDKPIDLYKRLKINVELCDTYKINVYSFPMKYHPLQGEFSHNRDYIGEHWNRKYIRAIQAILNSTKGKIGRGKSFFYKAFGKDENEFMMILEMPESFIIYRLFFEWIGKNNKHKASPERWKECWLYCMNTLNNKEKEQLLNIIHSNVFSIDNISCIQNTKAKELLSYYYNYRNDIQNKNSELYHLKTEYDNIHTNSIKTNVI